ncbi:phospholipase A1-Ibeta2, chloroplastic [Humulus lupulus]|uniref:phospholipase A1-Ibeta2, chloroplastic n=1 Tax=Humulus lupulus TaxID=3486 RepID=UPI002B406248|nr:phospholipase A1-Ibeta2, chloroplastic [Humulus lupulus]
MQIGSTPALNSNQFQAASQASFNMKMSPLNPLTRRSSSNLTRVHLANLEKLLQKPPLPEKLSTQTARENVSENISTGSSEKRGRNLLEGLNLARIWPEMRAADEMSPRHLNRLQQLLTKTGEGEYSPRNNLGRRWRDYHGRNDWEGLIDPLDENLRREVVRYGEFIQAAYRFFHSNPATPLDEPPKARHVALPDRTYKVTKSLYATSSVGLPKWVDDVAPDLGWMTQRSSWVGYVAVCDDKREIQRMGRRDIVISLRGTATCLEWAENVRAQLIQMPDEEEQGHDPDLDLDTHSHKHQPKVECGFLSLFKTRGAHVESLAESVVEEIKRLMELYKGEQLSITVTGHSLGAALALLVGDELSTCAEDVPPIAVFSFGGPRVGNRGFANRINDKNVKVLRIVNSQDVITRVPGAFLGEAMNDENERKTGVIGGVLEMLEDNMPLAYSHVGTELRVDTKMSPYLKPNADMACCHDLEAYLHLVDGFLASNCPFRSNAKRSLARLLQDQGSNVKKLYTSKAKSLSLNLERKQGLMHFPISLPSPS